MKKAAHTSIFQTSDFIAYTCLGIGLGLEYFIPTKLSLAVIDLRIFGAVLLFGAWGLIYAAKRQLNLQQQKSRPGFVTTTLVTEGIFSYTRNPIYLGVVLMVGAVGLLVGSIWVLVSALGVGVLINYTLIRPEERYLTDHFGETFATYKQRVRRWI